MRFVPLLLLSSALFAQIPTPECVLGHKPGDDFYLASYDESLGYFQKLAASTDKLKLVKVGKTTQGRDWYIAIISSPKNLADLEKYRDTARRLALVNGLNDAEAHALAHNGKVIVHIDGGLHATEVAGAQHTIQLAYNLVTGDHARDQPHPGQRDSAAVVLASIPTARTWWRTGTSRISAPPYEVSNMPGLWQEYIGHDNNRDGYMNNMVESQVITKAELEYYPQVFYNHHQTAPFPARIWIPPFGDPISADPHPLMWRWVNIFGTSMAAYLDEHGMPGAMHRGRFDDWYPGFVDHVNNFRNTISFLTETALYRYATPHFYTIDDFPRDKQDLRTEVFYSSPWKGGWWRLGDAVQTMLLASMAVLDTAAKYREECSNTRAIRPARKRDRAVQKRSALRLRDPARAARSADRRDAGGEAADRWNRSALARRIASRPTDPLTPPDRLGGADGSALRGSGEGAVRRAEISRVSHSTGAPIAGGRWWRRRRRPRSRGRTRQPPRQQRLPLPQPLTADGAADAEQPAVPRAPASLTQLPYDVTGWTLPMQMGVEVVAVSQPVAEDTRKLLRKIDKLDPIPGKVEGSGPVFAFSHNSNAALKAVNDILAAGGTVSFAKSGSTIYATGRAAPILQKDGVDAKSLNEAPAAAWPVKKPRIGDL